VHVHIDLASFAKHFPSSIAAPPRLIAFGKWLHKVPDGALGWFDTLASERLDMTDNPAANKLLRESLGVFLGLGEGSRLALWNYGGPSPAVVLVGSEAAGKSQGLSPRARIVATATSGADPVIMLTGPTPATKKVLDRAGLTVDDIDLFELNEAFASVVLKFQKDLNIPDEKLNVNGGAIAMGHPLGATGAMITGTMVDELERRNARRALVTLCIGGGMGVATIIERV